MNKKVLLILFTTTLSSILFSQNIILRSGVTFNQSKFERGKPSFTDIGNSKKYYHEVGYLHKIFKRLHTGLSFSELTQGGTFEYLSKENNKYIKIQDEYNYLQVNHILSVDVLTYKKFNLLFNWRSSLNNQISLSGVPKTIYDYYKNQETTLMNSNPIRNNFMSYNVGLALHYKQKHFSIGVSAEQIITPKPVIDINSNNVELSVNNQSFLLMIEATVNIFKDVE